MRPDSEIMRDVTDELAWVAILRDEEIAISVKDGVVTLSGVVNSYLKKHTAEKIAKRVPGVRAVALDLSVEPKDIFKKSDSEIAHAVIDALKWNSAVSADSITVRVEDGWVTLEGEAEWEFQKESAKSSVKNLIGVRGITNLIRLKPVLKMQDVKRKINLAFHRQATLDANRINVDAEDGKVILSGTVSSLVEKNDAEVAAWSAPGVKEVVNNIEVHYDRALVSY